MKKIYVLFLLAFHGLAYGHNETLEEYQQFFKEQIVGLRDVVTRADQGVQYWKHKKYRNDHAWVRLKNRREKYKKSITKLHEVKRSAAILLGMFYHFDSLCQLERRTEAEALLEEVRSVFSHVQENIDGLLLTARVEDFCGKLDRVCLKYQKPDHVERHWKSYAVGAIVLAALYDAYYRHGIDQKAQAWWHENITENIRKTREWKESGVFGQPYRMMEEPEVEGGSSFSTAGVARTVVREILRLVKIKQRVEDTVNYNKGINTAAFLKSTAQVLGLVYVGQKGLRYTIRHMLDKTEYIVAARYHVQKIHQILHAEYEHEHERIGLLYTHIRLLLEQVGYFSSETVEALLSDAARLRSVFIGVEEKQAIVSRWYNIYQFLQVSY